MAKFYIYASLCSRIGEPCKEEYEPIEADTLEDANQIAYEDAFQLFDSNGGLHGMGDTFEQFMEDNPDADEEDYCEYWIQEADSWISYHAITAEEWEALKY